jgi:hypothetical protein
VSIDETNVIDKISGDRETSDVLLFIFDHREWIGDELEHMYLLQEKINAYLRFVESDEIYEIYPHLKGRPVVIEVVGKFPLNERAQDFFNKVYPVIEGAGMKLRFTLFRADNTWKT